MDIKLKAFEFKFVDEFFNDFVLKVGDVTGKSLTIKNKQFAPIDRADRDKLTIVFKNMIDNENMVESILSLPPYELEILRYLLANCCLMIDELRGYGIQYLWIPGNFWLIFLTPLDLLLEQNRYAIENKIPPTDLVVFRLIDPSQN